MSKEHKKINEMRLSKRISKYGSGFMIYLSKWEVEHLNVDDGEVVEILIRKV